MDYSLAAAFRIIADNWLMLVKYTIIAVVVGIALFIAMPKKYEASTVFILRNPIFADRNNIYNYEAKFLNYIADDNDVDQLISMASSDSLKDKVIDSMHLATAYGFDSTDAEERHKLRLKFQKRLLIYRNEYKSIILSYKDKDPARAAAIANLCVDLLEKSLRGFYNGMRKNVYGSIMSKVHQEDSVIEVLTDSLSKLRDIYGIYDIVSPSRYNLMLSGIKNSGKDGFAKGIEKVQNVESIKDELVGDRAKHLSLANQYSTGTGDDEMRLTHVIQKATPPFKHFVLNLFINAGVSAILGLLFGVVILFAKTFFHKMNTDKI